MNKQGRDTADKTKHLTLMAMLFALSIVLSIVEGLLPAPTAAPGIKLGLSNIVVMFTLINLKKSDALIIAFLKAGFALLTRGMVAGILSLSGGLASVLIMLLLMGLLGKKTSYLGLSVSGAVFHNLGQITVASFILKTSLWYYFPILLISAIGSGFLTSVLLRQSAPLLKRLNLK
ncbi:MAG: Gx transporter family protein [Clostridiales bacterium]|nr:Gx transporter family protein [Clostridiales bacterium]